MSHNRLTVADLLARTVIRKPRDPFTAERFGHRGRSERLFSLEPLESRQLLAAVAWTGAGGDSFWHTPENWSGGAVPTIDDDVNIPDMPGTPTIQFTASAGSRAVKSLESRESVLLAGGSLQIGTTWQSHVSNSFAGGTLTGGTLTLLNGSQLLATPSGGTLSSVTVNGDVVLGTANTTLALSGTTTFTAARLMVGESTLFLAPGYVLNSSVIAEGPASGTRYVRLSTIGGVTIGPSGSIRLAAGCGGWLSLQSGSLTNLGVISAEATGQTLDIANTSFTNLGTVQATAGTLRVVSRTPSSGTLRATGTGRLDLGGGATIDGANLLSVAFGAQIELRGNLLGNATNRDLFAGPGTLVFDGSGTAASPQLFEAMSADRGLQAAGYVRNFVYGTIALANNTYVRLTDAFDNSAGLGPEAIYVNSIVVPAGTTLDLSGLRVYARAVQGAGTVIGTIDQFPDSGPISSGITTPGAISVPGELDEWTFFGNAGRSATIVVSPGAGTGTLRRAQLVLIDPANNVLGIVNSTNDGQTISLDDVRLPTNGTYRIQVRAAPSASSNTGSYSVTLWDVTPDIDSVDLNQLAFGNIENPFSVDRWNFSAVAGQQIRFDVRGSAAGGLRFSLTGPGGYKGFTDIDGDSALLTLPADGQYALTAHGSGGATGSYSFRIDQTTVTDLVIGTPQLVPNAGTDSAQLFRVSVGSASPLLLRLDDAINTNRNEVYIKFGSSPTRTDFDHRYDQPASADQVVLVPNAQPGSWYVLVYGASVPAPSVFTLEAVASSVVIRNATPDRYATNASAPLTITGAGFRPGLAVQLVDVANTVVAAATNVQINSFTQASALMPLAGVPQGQYRLRVRMPDGGTDVLDSFFTVLPNGQAHLETRLIMPGNVGRHAVATFYVEYANTGTAAMPAPLLRLQSADEHGSDNPILTLDPSLVTQGFWTSGLPDGFSTSIQILASGTTPGLLQPGERVSVPVYYAGLLQPWDPDDKQVEMEIRIFDSTNTDAVPWSDLRDGLRPFTITPDAWNAIYQNVVTNVGPTWGSFVTMLSDNAQFLDRLGQRVLDVNNLWNFEVQQAIGFSPVRTLASSIDASIPTPGSDPSFGRTYALAIDQRFNTSLFGRGWSVPWQTHLTVDADGSVNIIGAGGSRRRFQPDTRSNNAFFGLAGDSGVLSRISAGIYEVHEQSGDVVRFNAAGQIDWSRDANGNAVTMGYTAGRLTSLTHSSGASLTLAYNAAGLISGITDSVNRTTTFAYDPTNQYLLAVTAPDGQVTTYTYDTTPNSPKRHALTSVSSGGATRFYTYDAQGHLASTYTSGNASLVSFSYGSAGSVIAVDAGNGSTEFDYDHLGLLDRVVDPHGNVTTAEYGADLRLSRLVDPLGQSQSFTWCSCGSLTSVTNELGNTTRFGYDYVGPNNTIRRMTSFTDANGNTTRYTYDAQGNLLSTIYPNQSVERIGTYDPMGDPLSFINRRGQTLSYSYNTAGQVTRQTFQDGTFIDFGYDARGNLRTVTEPGSKITTFDYDTGDRLTKVTYPNGRFVAFTYDAFGRRDTMTDQTGFVVNYAYDAAGRLFRLTDGVGVLIVQYIYDAAGRLSRKDNGNATYTEYVYDLAGQVLSIVNRAPNGTVNSEFIYTYDELGRRITQQTIDGTWTYGYDATGQLTSAVFVPLPGSPIPAQDLEYVYDALGNRIKTVENGVTANYTTNNLNQYTRVGGDTLIYDADGNLVSRSGPSGNATYAYDQQGRLTRVVTPDGVWQYEYDAFGNRIASTLDDQRTEYLLDPTGLVDVVGEYAGAGALAARYVHGLGLVTRVDGTTDARAFYDFDAIGSTADMTDAGGQELNRYAYQSFGSRLFTSGSIANPFQFVGQFGVQEEGNGLSFMRARFANSSLGRFISVDPIGLSGGDPNLVRYGSNSPTNHIDALGLWDITIGNYPVIDTGPMDGTDAGCGSGNSQVTPDKFLGGDYTRACQEHDDAYATCNGSTWSQIKGKFKADANLFKGVNGQSGPVIGGAYWLGVTVGGWGPYFDAQGKACRPPPPTPPTPPGPPGGPSGSGGGSSTSNSSDPNHLLGPSGYGAQHFVRRDAVLPYRIEFENYGPGSKNADGSPVSSDRWATAPAQRVVITNTLSTSLDLYTVLITGFGFGDFNISLALPAQSFQQVLTMTLNGHTFEVWFEAGLDYATRRLNFTFQSIDPATFLPPDVLTGVLPPEDGKGSGKGFVTYIVRPVSGLPTGTEIRNMALISFDNQTFIATNQNDPLHPELGTDPEKEALVTLDAGLPQSAVKPLPPNLFGHSFTVRWSGTDDAGGSGVGMFTIYVSINGGDFKPWLVNTPDTEAVYRALVNGTYAFYSVATDHAGNTESPPASADASTVLSVLDQTTGTNGVGLTVNDGNAQRSMVDSLTLTFLSRVTLQDGAVTLLRRGQPFHAQLNVANPSGDHKTYVVTFSGADILAGSLADGVYDLLLQSKYIRDDFGNQARITDRRFTFHRLFGDTDGNRTVDALDMARLRTLLGSELGDDTYVWWMDREGDGDIDSVDALWARQNLGTRYDY